jgi:hypothetical protein
MQLDLTQKFSVSDGGVYKLSLVDIAIPVLNHQTFWRDKDNSTLYCYGGNVMDPVSVLPDKGVWTYTIADRKWTLRATSMRPVRLTLGGTFDLLPASLLLLTIISKYHMSMRRTFKALTGFGGFQSDRTTSDISDLERRIFSRKMIQYNTTTRS